MKPLAGLRETVLAALVLLVAAPLAAAQEDPTLNESDMDTEPPASDESYLDEGNGTASGGNATGDGAPAEGDPTVTESDFDMSAPPADESYLGDGSGSSASGDAATPGPGFAILAAGIVVAAFVLGRR